MRGVRIAAPYTLVAASRIVSNGMVRWRSTGDKAPEILVASAMSVNDRGVPSGARLVQCSALTRPFATLALAIAALSMWPVAAAGQDPPPRIGPVVADLHLTVPRFPSEQQLADSRSLALRELPGTGLGLHAGAHVYLLKWKAVTFGLGGDFTLARAHVPARLIAVDQLGRAVTERFTHVAPELSFNFGSGNGWSYVSGGIGPSTWSIVPDGTTASSASTERIRTINYGGGARWFAKRHVAFSLDVRFYAIDPGAPDPGRPGGPRTTLLIIGGGVSIK